MKTDNYTFEVLKFRKLHNWKLMEVDEKIPFSRQERCPSDGETLKAIVTLVGNGGRKMIRLGCCDHCGYVGYIDRPTKEWIDNFYYETWNTTAELLDEKKMRKAHERYLSGGDRAVNAVRMVEVIPYLLQKERPICEIGCGYGITLKRMLDLGFQQAIGTESSLQRAAIANKLFGVNVVTAPFEEDTAQQELKKFAPYGIIFSHHVLEHVYNPEEIIRSAAGLQATGDYFIISLPNVVGEFSLSRVFYLPHLHSYTRYSLASLLARHGYEVLDDSFTSRKELAFVAKKVSNPTLLGRGGGYFLKTLEKFRSYFQLGKDYRSGRRLFWGFRSIDAGGTFPYFGENIITRAIEILASRTLPFIFKTRIKALLGFTPEGRPPLLTVVMRDTSKRFTAFEDSPVEIQFRDNILLTYK